MSHSVELTRRTKDWELGQTTMTLSPDVAALPNLDDMHEAALELAEMVLRGMERKAKEDGMPLVILTARVVVTCSAYMEVNP